jgi:general secretion pathway protein K
MTRMRDRQRGIALVLTLWLTVLLTAIAGGFAYSMHTEAIAAGNAIGVARVRAAADGAVERAVYELAKPRVPARGSPTARRTRGRTARST